MLDLKTSISQGKAVLGGQGPFEADPRTVTTIHTDESSASRGSLTLSLCATALVRYNILRLARLLRQWSLLGEGLLGIDQRTHNLQNNILLLG